mmetsp:Transcript_4065/g.9767  ORF Transcript_4065/g.9767 Transcript_4065/m.9767 type:complete len:313 (+) Transcript_4065:114-1052(+)
MAPLAPQRRISRSTARRSEVAAAAVAALVAISNRGVISFAAVFASPFRDIYMAGCPNRGSVLVGVPFERRRHRCTDLSRCATAAYSDPSADLVGPDPSVAGQLRALGRLLRSASGRLVAAAQASTAGAYLPSDFGELRVLSCGTAMQGTAEALLAEQWHEAQKRICDMPSQCNALLCKDDLKALQSVLSGWQPGSELRDALQAVGKKLEAATETADEALKDVLFDLAAAVHAGSRLFISQPAANRPAVNDNQQSLFQQIERSVSRIPVKEQQAYLRELAKRYHPDRNPGREVEVLPAFLHVQYLRNLFRQWN